MRVSDIESELPNSFENLSYSNNSLESEICSLREAYEKRLFSFADDGGKWISVNEVQKQTAEEYWKELKQYPVPDMFQVITWRANELIDNLDLDPRTPCECSLDYHLVVLSFCTIHGAKYCNERRQILCQQH